MEESKKKLRNYAFVEGYLRENYLKDWTRRHPDDPIEGFAILDDEEFDYDKVWLDDWLIKTEYYSRDEATAGLTDAHIPKAISLIESETLRGKIKYVLEKNENID